MVPILEVARPRNQVCLGRYDSIDVQAAALALALLPSCQQFYGTGSTAPCCPRSAADSLQNRYSTKTSLEPSEGRGSRRQHRQSRARAHWRHVARAHWRQCARAHWRLTAHWRMCLQTCAKHSAMPTEPVSAACLRSRRLDAAMTDPDRRLGYCQDWLHGQALSSSPETRPQLSFLMARVSESPRARAPSIPSCRDYPPYSPRVEIEGAE
jgi:hypothetical protein